MPMTDAEVFWSARPVLTHIRTLARSRRVGPWAVLGTAMARAVATIPPTCRAARHRRRTHVTEPVRGTGRSSGAGKGGADAAATAGVNFHGLHVDSLPLGSGEGASRTFRPLGTPPDEPNPVTSVVFTVPEIDTLTALTSRQGSTLSAELRKLYSGEALGFANAGKDTRTLVAAHSYRACVIVGVQPLRSHALLAGADGGLPNDSSGCPPPTPTHPNNAHPTPAAGTHPNSPGRAGIPGTCDSSVPTSPSQHQHAPPLMPIAWPCCARTPASTPSTATPCSAASKSPRH